MDRLKKSKLEEPENASGTVCDILDSWFFGGHDARSAAYSNG